MLSDGDHKIDVGMAVLKNGLDEEHNQLMLEWYRELSSRNGLSGMFACDELGGSPGVIDWSEDNPILVTDKGRKQEKI